MGHGSSSKHKALSLSPVLQKKKKKKKKKCQVAQSRVSNCEPEIALRLVLQ
jgi:hypothetical protein